MISIRLRSCKLVVLTLDFTQNSVTNRAPRTSLSGICMIKSHSDEGELPPCKTPISPRNRMTQKGPILILIDHTAKRIEPRRATSFGKAMAELEDTFEESETDE